MNRSGEGKIELMAPAGSFEALQAAIDNGADTKKIFERLQKEYPLKSKEMRTILDTAQMSPELKQKVKESVERINSGKAKKTDEYRILAADYPEDQAILRKILLTPPDEDMLGALMEIFAN